MGQGVGRVPNARQDINPEAPQSFAPIAPERSRRLIFDPERIQPQWQHPLLLITPGRLTRELTKKELQAYAYDYFMRFLPFFRHRPEGSLAPGVTIEFTRKMRQKLGLAFLFEHKIKLNQTYFTREPALLPYTLFHEMTHIWLYDCGFDPGHTKRFYRKMSEFSETGLPVDPDVHIHRRVASEAKFIYMCPNCRNRWYLREQTRYRIYCGYCHAKHKVEIFAELLTQRPNVGVEPNRPQIME